MTRKLKRMIRRTMVATSLLSLLCAAGVATAEDAPKDWSITGSTDLVNKYVWRGLLLNEDPVLEPSVTATWKGLSLNIWGNVDTTSFNNSLYGNAIDDREWKFSEVDYTLSYTHAIDKVSLTGGYIYYQYPGMHFDATQEVFGSVALNDTLPWGVVPSLAAYYDIDEVNGLYMNLGLAKSLEIVKDRLGLDLATGLGWGNAENNKFYYFDPDSGNGLDQSGFLDASISATLNWKVTSSFTVSPYVKYSEIVDHELASALDNNMNSNANSVASGSAQTVVGLRVAYSF